MPRLAARPHRLPDVGNIGMIVRSIGCLGVDPLEDRHHDGFVALVIDADEELFVAIGRQFQSPQSRPVPGEQILELGKRPGSNPEGADHSLGGFHCIIISDCAKCWQVDPIEGARNGNHWCSLSTLFL